MYTINCFWCIHKCYPFVLCIYAGNVCLYKSWSLVYWTLLVGSSCYILLFPIYMFHSETLSSFSSKTTSKTCCVCLTWWWHKSEPWIQIKTFRRSYSIECICLFPSALFPNSQLQWFNVNTSSQSNTVALTV